MIIKKITLILFTLFPLFSNAYFKAISTEQMQEKIKEGIVIIDVRRQDEYDKYGIIPNSHRLTFFDKNGRYNVQQWLNNLLKIVLSKNTPFVLVCAHANRTKIIGNFLNKNAIYKNIFELDGGINNGWIDKGLMTTKLPL